VPTAEPARTAGADYEELKMWVRLDGRQSLVDVTETGRRECIDRLARKFEPQAGDAVNGLDPDMG
jgi:hypothetical protein